MCRCAFNKLISHFKPICFTNALAFDLTFISNATSSNLMLFWSAVYSHLVNPMFFLILWWVLFLIYFTTIANKYINKKLYIYIFTLKYQLSKIHLYVVVCKSGKRKKAPPLDKVVVTDRVQWVHARMATTWGSAMLGISSKGEVSSLQGPQASWARWTNLQIYININILGIGGEAAEEHSCGQAVPSH